MSYFSKLNALTFQWRITRGMPDRINHLSVNPDCVVQTSPKMILINCTNWLISSWNRSNIAHLIHLSCELRSTFENFTPDWYFSSFLLFYHSQLPPPFAGTGYILSKNWKGFRYWFTGKGTIVQKGTWASSLSKILNTWRNFTHNNGWCNITLTPTLIELHVII